MRVASHGKCGRLECAIFVGYNCLFELHQTTNDGMDTLFRNAWEGVTSNVPKYDVDPVIVRLIAKFRTLVSGF